MSEEKLCDGLVYARFTWPGQDEKYACLLHCLKLAEISQAMGLYLQFIPLGPNELDGKHCNQHVRVGEIPQ